MVGHTANLFNHYTSDPTQRDYQILAALFLMSGESPQSVMAHGEEWVSATGRLEFMTIIEYAPDMVQAWYDGCCIGFKDNRPLHMTWYMPMDDESGYYHDLMWEPQMGPAELNRMCSCTVDASKEKVRVNLITPILNMKALAAFAQ